MNGLENCKKPLEWRSWARYKGTYYGMMIVFMMYRNGYQYWIIMGILFVDDGYSLCICNGYSLCIYDEYYLCIHNEYNLRVDNGYNLCLS